MNELIKYALKYEQEDNLNESEKYYLRALADYPNDKEVLSYSAIFLFKKGDYENALDLFVQAYSHPDQWEDTREDLFNHIIDAYYQPYEETLKNTYLNNVQALRAYEHNCIPYHEAFEDLSYLCIPRNESESYIWDKRTKSFSELLVIDKTITSYQVAIDDCVVGVNLFDLSKLQSLMEQTRNPAWIDNIKVPVYIVWRDNKKMQQYLQLVNYATIIQLQRAVFFSDYGVESKFVEFFSDHQAILPNKLVGDDQYFQEIILILNRVSLIREQDIAQKLTKINQMAQKYDKKFYQKLFSGSSDRIRILFYTCRFSTFIQYANRDFMQACQALGIQCEVLIEKSDIHRVPPNTELVHRIAIFKPNIIFFIHYFKSDFKVIPPNIMSLSWLQDPNTKFTSREHAQQFRWNDFALTYTHNWREQMIDSGYDSSRIRVQPVPIDENVFNSRNLTQEERELYQSDIAFVGNYMRPEKDLANLLIKYTNDTLSPEVKNRVINLLVSTYDSLGSKIGNNELIVSIEQCKSVINEFAKSLEINIEVAVSQQIAQDFFYPLCYNLHRKITLKWLIDAGFHVKLWGNGWDIDPNFKASAMGPLTHGTNLAKMYSCAKIVPGTFFWSTAHYRCWESTASGALCMNRYIPKENDQADIREFLTENEHFIFYDSKQDLISKVNYYLTHEEERKRVVENGKLEILKNLTYTSAVHKCLNLIKENLANM